MAEGRDGFARVPDEGVIRVSLGGEGSVRHAIENEYGFAQLRSFLI